MCDMAREIIIFVDALKDSNGEWQYKKHCHLFSEEDDTDNKALHSFAKKIGLKRDWFHDPSIFPHYDLNESKRKQAIRAGALDIDYKK